MVENGIQETVQAPQKTDDDRPALIDVIRREWVWAQAFFSRWLSRCTILGLWLLPLLAAVHGFVWVFSHKQTYDSVDEIPVRYAGLILGCPEKVGTDDNAFFLARVNAAKVLFDAGKVQFLIASGHPDREGCDEPRAIKAALVARGVPAEKIYCDHGGGRMLDSVLRARQVFGQRDLTVISQEFQNERAVYMARRRGLPDTVAFNAKEAVPWWTIRTCVKEVLARVLAVHDVEVRRLTPKFSGEKINVGPHWPPPDAPTTLGETSIF